MKIIIEIPEKTNAHIRSDYGHGVRGLRIEDMEMLVDAVYHGEPYHVRPRGEWKKTGRTNIYGGFEIECSVCHTTLMVSPNRWEIGENFCDVCGADMREEGGEK